MSKKIDGELKKEIEKEIVRILEKHSIVVDEFDGSNLILFPYRNKDLINELSDSLLYLLFIKKWIRK